MDSSFGPLRFDLSLPRKALCHLFTPLVNKLKTIAEILSLATNFLTEHKIDRARRISEDLLSHVLGVKRLDLYMQYDRPLIESEIVKMREVLKQAITRQPIAYILGEVDFYGCRIRVTPDVLIPRPETEILVDYVSKKIIQKPNGKKVFWDLCTGSGCIGLAIKRACPDLTVVISDISNQAIAVAEKNKALNQLDVECRVGDLLQPFINERADFVICNPPYISNSDYHNLDRSVREFEPAIALKGGERGVDFYEKLSQELPRFLNPGAQLFFEIGHDQGIIVQEIFRRPPWCHFQLLKDWAGHDRFFFLEIE